MLDKSEASDQPEAANDMAPSPTVPASGGGGPSSSGNADLDTIRVLVRLMHRYDLTAIDLMGSSTQIRLRRNSHTAGIAGPVPFVGGAGAGYPAPGAAGLATLPPAPMALPSLPTAPPPSSAPVSDAGSATKGQAVIESPMVGTFYTSSSPGTPPFVNVGSTVSENTTVCVIEAMKVFTDIPAGVSGVITEVLVKNGQAVEYGQPLFRVKN